jgi:hypothetical protein
MQEYAHQRGKMAKKVIRFPKGRPRQIEQQRTHLKQQYDR